MDRLAGRAAERFAALRAADHPFDYWTKKLFAIHRVADARDVLLEIIRQECRKMDLKTQGTEDFTYRTDRGLSDSNERFRVWKVVKGVFTDAEMP